MRPLSSDNPSRIAHKFIHTEGVWAPPSSIYCDLWFNTIYSEVLSDQYIDGIQTDRQISTDSDRNKVSPDDSYENKTFFWLNQLPWEPFATFFIWYYEWKILHHYVGTPIDTQCNIISTKLCEILTQQMSVINVCMDIGIIRKGQKWEEIWTACVIQIHIIKQFAEQNCFREVRKLYSLWCPCGLS